MIRSIRDPRRRCAPRCRATPSAPTTTIALVLPASALAGQRPVCAGHLEQALGDIARSACRRSPRATPRPSCSATLRRHHGPGAGRGHGGAILPSAGRVVAGLHHLLPVPGGEAPRPPAVPRSACTLTMASRLILIWGSNSITSTCTGWLAQAAKRQGAAGVHRPSAHWRRPTSVTSNIAIQPGHRRRTGLLHDARADQPTIVRPRPSLAMQSPRPCARRFSLWPPERRRGVWHRGRRECANWRATTPMHGPPRSG